MNPDLKARWVAALRSGKYKQGYGALRPTEDTYCCLGVLCDIYAPDGWVMGAGEPYAFGRYEDTSYLPPTLSLDPGRSRRRQGQLTLMNDEKRRSFTEIADWIEENL